LQLRLHLLLRRRLLGPEQKALTLLAQAMR
jgi:hypothetical protein